MDIYIGNISNGTTEDVIRRAFAYLGDTIRVKIIMPDSTQTRPFAVIHPANMLDQIGDMIGKSAL